jgi:Protein of unknown function (DUF2934)
MQHRKRPFRTKTLEQGAAQMEKQHLACVADPAPPRVITADERHRMIAMAAYYRAERRGFQNDDPCADWLEAEAEIDHMLERSLMSQRLTQEKMKHVFLCRLERELRDLDDCLARVVEKLRGSPQCVMDEYETLFGLYSENRWEAIQRLKTLRARPDGTWEDLRTDTEKLWWDLNHTIDQIAAFAALTCINRRVG